MDKHLKLIIDVVWMNIAVLAFVILYPIAWVAMDKHRFQPPSLRIYTSLFALAWKSPWQDFKNKSLIEEETQ